MKKVFLIAILTFLSFFNVANANSDLPNSISLPEVLLHTYENNEAILAERANLKAIKSNRLKVVGTGFMPEVYGEYNNSNSDKKYDREEKYNTDVQEASINLEQPLFKSGRSVIAVKGANREIEQQKAYLRDVEQHVLYEAINSFISIIRDEEILKLSIENHDALKKSHEYSIARNKAGQATRAEVATAKARFFEAKSEVDKASRNLSFSKANFEKVVGIRPENIEKSKEKNGITLKFDYDNEEIDLKERIIQDSIIKNPSLQLAKAKYRTEKNNVNYSKSDFFPSASLIASKAKGEDNVKVVNETRDYTSDSILFNVKIPLFQAGSEYANLKYNQNKLKKSKYDLKYKQHEIREEASRAYETFVASKSIVESTKAYVEAIGLSLKSISVEERYGRKTLINVLDIRREYHDAKIQMTIAEATGILSFYKVKQALGELNPKDLKLINKKPGS